MPKIAKKFIMTCECCGSKQEIIESRYLRGARYCSRECAKIAKKTSVEITCACGCGRTKLVAPSAIAAGRCRFYDRFCMNQYLRNEKLAKSGSVAVHSNGTIKRLKTESVLARLNGDRSLIAGTIEMAKIIGCEPARVAVLARHDKYMFPKPCESISHGNTYRNYYKVSDIEAYKDTYNDLIENKEVKPSREDNNKKMVDMSVKFFGGNPAALKRYGKAKFPDDNNQTELDTNEPIDTSLSADWKIKNEKLKVFNHFMRTWK